MLTTGFLKATEDLGAQLHARLDACINCAGLDDAAWQEAHAELDSAFDQIDALIVRLEQHTVS